MSYLKDNLLKLSTDFVETASYIIDELNDGKNKVSNHIDKKMKILSLKKQKNNLFITFAKRYYEEEKIDNNIMKEIETIDKEILELEKTEK